MRKNLKYLCLLLIAVLLLSSCSYNRSKNLTDLTGLKVINNSSKQNESISIKNNVTGQHADGSFIKNGDSLFFDFPLYNIYDYKIYITAKDKDGIEHNSQVFTRDLSIDALYYIYIIDTPNGELAFSDRLDGK